MMRKEFCLVLEAQKTTDDTDIRNDCLVRSTTNAHEWTQMFTEKREGRFDATARSYQGSSP